MTPDARQKQVVECLTHCVVAACPGSGKTATQASKAAHLLQTTPDRVGAVSFGRAASGELRERIQARVTREQAKRLTAGTFHSLCIAQLKRAKVKYPRIINAAESAAFAAAALRKLEILPEELSVQDAQLHIDAYRVSTEIQPYKGKYAALAREYGKVIKQNQRIDFSDFIQMAVQGMQDGSVKPLDVDHLLIDEAQDMDSLQLSWILCHVKAGAVVTLVGDDDQSLYSWRSGMGYAGMMYFRDAVDAQVIRLGINYRSAPNILAAAQRLIRFIPNDRRLDKEMKAHVTQDGTIRVIHANNRTSEFDKLIATLLAQPGEWGIIARTNAVLDELEIPLKGSSIPFTRVGGSNSLGRGVVGAFTAILTSVFSHKAEGLITAMQRVRKLHAYTSNPALENTARPGQAVLLEIMESQGLPTNPSPKAPHYQLARLYTLWLDWERLARDSSDALIVKGVARWLRSTLPRDSQNPHRCSVSAAGSEQAIDIVERMLTTPLRDAAGKAQVNVRQKLRNMLSGRDTDAPQETPNESQITLITAHSSKGLEYDNVWVVACEQGSMPPESPENPDEERRLAFVAMTRAKTNLFLSYSNASGASPYLVESGVMADVPQTTKGYASRPGSDAQHLNEREREQGQAQADLERAAWEEDRSHGTVACEPAMP